MRHKFATADGIVEYVDSQVKDLLKGGDEAEILRMVDLLYHSYSLVFSPATDEAKRKDVHRNRMALTEKMGEALGRDINAKAPSSSSLIFLISYPRSGVTLLSNLLTDAGPSIQYTAMKGRIQWFTKAAYPEHSPLVRYVKDHAMRSEYQHDTKLATIRDGRDSMTSLAYMTFQRGRHKFSRVEDLPKFLEWTNKDYEFGSWVDYVRQVKKYFREDEDTLVRYEELVKDDKEFFRVLQRIPELSRVSKKEASTIYKKAGEIKDKIKKSPANKMWGFGEEIKDEDMSLFAEWSKNRGSSSWQSVWTKPAGEVFHEMGGTDLLIEMGYETDQDWWKQL